MLTTTTGGIVMFKKATLAAMLAIVTLTGSVQAATLTFDLSYEFSGATPPAGAAPWLRAHFDDGGTPGSVMMTLSTPNLTGVEFVSKWCFNLDPVMDPTALLFLGPAKTGSFTNPAITTGVDFYKADGDGKYDILFSFDVSDGSPTRFGVGDSAKYLVLGAGLTASSFDYLSAPAGGHGPFEVAAHVQGIGPTGANSGWITVPEPTTMGLLGLGGLGLLRRRRN